MAFWIGIYVSHLLLPEDSISQKYVSVKQLYYEYEAVTVTAVKPENLHTYCVCMYLGKNITSGIKYSNYKRYHSSKLMVYLKLLNPVIHR